MGFVKAASVAPVRIAAPISLTDSVYGRLRRDILSCELLPGQEVSESQLASRYEVGKAPVRAALMRLCTDGLVSSQARRGYLIAPITLRDAQEIMDLRMVLEPHAARLAAGRVDGALLCELEAACLEGYTPGDRASEEAFLESNKHIHVAIVAASGHRRLASAVEALIDEMGRVLHVALAADNKAVRLQHEHHMLIEALVRGDGDEAARLSYEALADFREEMLDSMLNAPDLLDSALAVAPRR
jgi:DNA-binding GntR family transcriptional regulator